MIDKSKKKERTIESTLFQERNVESALFQKNCSITIRTISNQCPRDWR